jgi:hypothetical protein
MKAYIESDAQFQIRRARERALRKATRDFRQLNRDKFAGKRSGKLQPKQSTGVIGL